MTIASNSNYTDNNFKRLELNGAKIVSSEFTDCKFSKCDFSEVTFQSCRFIDCHFDDCSMKMTKLEKSTFSQVKFTRCNLLGVNWTEANWSDWLSKLSSVEFSNCELVYAVFFGLALKKLKLLNCNARETNFAEADLEETDFTGTDLEGAVFLRSNLIKANFVGAKNYGLSLNDNKTKGARFALPEAIRLLYYMDIALVDPESNEPLDEDKLNDYIN